MEFGRILLAFTFVAGAAVVCGSEKSSPTSVAQTHESYFDFSSRKNGSGVQFIPTVIKHSTSSLACAGLGYDLIGEVAEFEKRKAIISNSSQHDGLVELEPNCTKFSLNPEIAEKSSEINLQQQGNVTQRYYPRRVERINN